MIIDSYSKISYIISVSNSITSFNEPKPFFIKEKFIGKNILVQINSRIEDYKKELEIKNKLKALNNIEDKKSLAHWALNQTKKLDLLQVIILKIFSISDIKWNKTRQ